MAKIISMDYAEENDPIFSGEFVISSHKSKAGSMKSTSTSQTVTASPETKASTNNTDEKATLPTQKM